MKNHTTVYEINGEKLDALILEYCKEHGTSPAFLSEELGYSRCFFKDSIRRGRINTVGIKFLEKNCDIKYADYALKVGKEEVSPTPDKVEPTSVEEKLNKIIALLENISNIPDMSSLYDVKSEISKIGNIQMQQLEYLKEIKDKPAVKPYVKVER